MFLQCNNRVCLFSLIYLLYFAQFTTEKRNSTEMSNNCKYCKHEARIDVASTIIQRRVWFRTRIEVNCTRNDTMFPCCCSRNNYFKDAHCGALFVSATSKRTIPTKTDDKNPFNFVRFLNTCNNGGTLNVNSSPEMFSFRSEIYTDSAARFVAWQNITNPILSN